MSKYLFMMCFVVIVSCSNNNDGDGASLEADRSKLRCRCEGRQSPWLPAKWAYVRRDTAGVAVSQSEIFDTQDICIEVLRKDKNCIYEM